MIENSQFPCGFVQVHHLLSVDTCNEEKLFVQMWWKANDFMFNNGMLLFLHMTLILTHNYQDVRNVQR